jgi:hypothetical protein
MRGLSVNALFNGRHKWKVLQSAYGKFEQDIKNVSRKHKAMGFETTTQRSGNPSFQLRSNTWRHNRSIPYR